MYNGCLLCSVEVYDYPLRVIKACFTFCDKAFQVSISLNVVLITPSGEAVCYLNTKQCRRKDILIGGWGTVLICSTGHIEWAWHRLKTWGGAHAPGAPPVPMPMFNQTA